MSARKLVYRLMVFAPALFLVGIGVNARVLNTDFDFVANDARTERFIQAYVPYLRIAETAFRPKHQPTDDEMARVAQAWVNGAERGELKPLNPISYDDTSSDGAKSEIFDTHSRIASHLINQIPRDEASGDIHKAVSDAVLVIKLSAIVKYSDFVSLFNSAVQQRRAIHHIERFASALSPADKKAMLNVLPSVAPCERIVDVMMCRSKQLFLTWRERRGFPPLSIEDTQILSDVPAVIKDGSAVSARQLRERVFASEDDYVPTFCSSLRLGVSAENTLARDAAKLRSLLK